MCAWKRIVFSSNSTNDLEKMLHWFRWLGSVWWLFEVTVDNIKEFRNISHFVWAFRSNLITQFQTQNLKNEYNSMIFDAKPVSMSTCNNVALSRPYAPFLFVIKSHWFGCIDASVRPKTVNIWSNRKSATYYVLYATEMRNIKVKALHIRRACDVLLCVVAISPTNYN